MLLFYRVGGCVKKLVLNLVPSKYENDKCVREKRRKVGFSIPSPEDNLIDLFCG